MFETSVIRARSMRAPHRYRLLTLSLAFHGCAIAAVITATLISTRLPDEAPAQMSIPILLRPVSLPPALGTPHAQPRPAAAKPRAVTGPVAPRVIPDQSQPATPSSTTQDSTGPLPASGTGDAGGDAVGVPGGVPGGIGTDTSGLGEQSANDAPLPVGGEVKAPVVIERVLPEYPRVAMMGRINGWVIVECIIDKTGHIRDARVVKSTFPAFEKPAIDAVQRWVFTPGTLHGQPVDVIFDLTVVFQVK